MTTTLTLHDHPASANGYKIRLLLAHLGRPYRVREVDIFAGESHTPAFLARNPAGSVPVLELETGEHLAESNACLVYVAEGTPLLPDAPLDRARVLQWMFFEQNQVEPNLGSARFWMLTGRDAGRREALALKLAQGKEALATMDRHLATRSFFVAERYTIADVALFAYTHLANDAGVDLAAYPHVSAWLARVTAQPGFVRGALVYPASARVTGAS